MPKNNDAFKGPPVFYRPDEFAERSDDLMRFDGLDIEPHLDLRERPALARIVIRYRALLKRHAEAPNREEVAETLRQLSKMGSDEAAAYWRRLHAACRVEIDRAALLLFRRQHGPAALYRTDIGYHKEGPANLPPVAALALKTMPKRRPGAPQVTHWAINFARALAVHWYKERQARPTINRAGYTLTDFQRWAEDLFYQAGFPVGNIDKHLKEGRAAAVRDGKIPKK